jgi:hypothetical protein
MPTSTTSIAELQSTGITLRADEAVAIAQQLIDNSVDREPRSEPPFGPPSPENVFVDGEGFVVCRACETTPAVSEIAIFLQAVLPVGTPRVPGALRYTIARALLEVDAPPFDSIQHLSQALTRFESGDRTAVVRALVARTRSVQPVPERRRVSALAVGVAVGLCLIRVGEFMHTRSTVFRPAAVITQPAPDRDPTPTTPPPIQDEARAPSTPAAAPVATTGSRPVRVDKTMKPVAKPAPSRVEGHALSRVEGRTLRAATAAAAPRARGTNDKRGIMDRLRLGWLRKAFTVRSDPL